MYDYYKEKGLKLTDFGGWTLPIQFTKIIEEHQAVRNQVGMFDVAHMGEIRITGGKALDFVNSVITNDATKLEANQSMYTAKKFCLRQTHQTRKKSISGLCNKTKIIS